MDANTLMSLIGLFGGSGSAPAQQAPTPHTPGVGQMKLDGVGTGIAPTPGNPQIAAPPKSGTPIMQQRPTWDINSDTIPLDRQPVNIPAITQQAPQHKGGFSTGNILTALLGSNFGQS